MGWNDRLPEDPTWPNEQERQAYFDWQEYHHYLAQLEAALDQEERQREQDKETGGAEIQSERPVKGPGAARLHFLGHSGVSEREEAPGCPRRVLLDSEKRGDAADGRGQEVPDHSEPSGQGRD